MPESLAKYLIHLIYGTKNPDVCLTAPVRRTLFAYDADHPHTTSFQEKLRLFLKRYGMDHDERYVWD